ncbi:MAG: hypothetical protein WDM81_01690 [Rhizomicrobium sp.]
MGALQIVERILELTAPEIPSAPAFERERVGLAGIQRLLGQLRSTVQIARGDRLIDPCDKERRPGAPARRPAGFAMSCLDRRTLPNVRAQRSSREIRMRSLSKVSRTEQDVHVAGGQSKHRRGRGAADAFNRPARRTEIPRKRPGLHLPRRRDISRRRPLGGPRGQVAEWFKAHA